MQVPTTSEPDLSVRAVLAQSDARRLFQLVKSTSRATHPFCKFSTGNLETLETSDAHEQARTYVDLLRSSWCGRCATDRNAFTRVWRRCAASTRPTTPPTPCPRASSAANLSTISSQWQSTRSATWRRVSHSTAAQRLSRQRMVVRRVRRNGGAVGGGTWRRRSGRRLALR